MNRMTHIVTRIGLGSVQVTLVWCIVCATVMHARLSSAAPFTVVVLPDTQFYSESYPEQFLAQTEWIVDNRESESIAFVSHVGDVVQNGGEGRRQNADEWNNADVAMKMLDDFAPDLPYGVVIGNHDYDRVNDQNSAEHFVSFFGSSRYSERQWYGGSSPDQLNHFQRFRADGRDYLHIALEWQPPLSSLRWAQSVLDGNPNIPTIVSTHDYSTQRSGTSIAGRNIFNNLVDHNSQVFMVLSGHAPGEGHQTVTNAAGLEVFEMLANFQMRSHGGDGWLRLIEFDDVNDQIKIKTYSPTLDRFKTSSVSQFTLNVDFDSRFGVVPEPSTRCLAAAGLVGVISYARRRKQAT